MCQQPSKENPIQWSCQKIGFSWDEISSGRMQVDIRAGFTQPFLFWLMEIWTHIYTVQIFHFILLIHFQWPWNYNFSSPSLCNKAKFEWLHTWHIGLVFSFCEWGRKLEHRIQEQLQKKFPIPKTFAILKTKNKIRKSPIFCWPRMTSFARAPGVWCQKQEETRSDRRKPAGWWVTDVHYTLHCGILAKTTRDPVWGGVKVDLTGSTVICSNPAPYKGAIAGAGLLHMTVEPVRSTLTPP